jgi:hypothetical protein
MKYTGVDKQVFKITMKAVKSGLVDGSQTNGFVIKVIEHGSLRNEVKRIGYFTDRGAPLELRIGDTLLFYISHF